MTAKAEIIGEKLRELTTFLQAINNPQTPEEHAINRDHQARVERSRLEIGDKFGLPGIVHTIYTENRDFYKDHPARQIPPLDKNIQFT